MPGINLYLTIEQYLSQSFPYFLEHLADGVKNEIGEGHKSVLTSQSHVHTGE